MAEGWMREIGSPEWNARPYPRPGTAEAKRREALLAARTEFIQNLRLPVEVGTGKSEKVK